MRNNNPGNIRLTGGLLYRGERRGADSEFRTFVAPEWGYRAIFVLLHTYSVRYGLNTIAGAIARWAPPSENNTAAYIERVERLTGRSAQSPYDTLTEEDMVPIAAAISEVENGCKADRKAVEKGWRLFREDYGE